MKPQVDTRKIVFFFLCLLALSNALISGGIYSWYRHLFIFAAFMIFMLSIAGTRPATGWAVFFLPAAAAWLSSLWTVNLNNTAGQAFFLTAMAFFGFAAASSAGGERKGLILGIFVAAAAAVSIYGIYQYFIGFAHTEEFVRQSGISSPQAERALVLLENRRAFSTMMSPNILACYLAVAVPVTAALLINGKNKLIYGFALTTVLAALFLTKSIGGLLALSGGLAVFSFFLLRQGRLKAKPAVALALVFALAAAGALFAVKMRSGGEFSFANTVRQRSGYYAASLGVSKGHVLLGRGAGSFQILYPMHKKPGADETRYAHNLFLQSLAEEGLLGVAAITALFIFFFFNCLRRMRERPEEALIFAGVASGGAAFLIHNMVDFSWYVPETAAGFWLLTGLAASGEDGGRPASGKAARLAMAGLSLAFIIFFSMSYRSHSCLEGSMAVLREAGITTAGAARSSPVPPEAVSLAEEAVRLKPYDDGLHSFLAGLYEGRATADGPKLAFAAEREYKKAIALNPQYPFHYRDLGIFYLKFGRKEKAVLAFRKAVSLYPASDSLKQHLSFAENR